MAGTTSSVAWPRLLTPSHLANLIRRQKSPTAALRLFTLAPILYPTTYRHTTPVFSALISHLLPSPVPSHRPFLLSLLRHLPISSSRDSLLSLVIPSLSPPQALSLFPDPLTLFSLPLSFHSLLNLLISNHQLTTARHVILNTGPRLDLRTLNLIISTLCRLNHSDLALDVFLEIKEQCCYPNQETYRILMRGLCESGRLDDAVHLLYSMLWRISQKGCEADVIVYRMLLDSLVENGRVKQAEEVLGKVLLKGLRSPSKRRSFRKPELEGLEVEEMRRRIDEALVVGGVRSLKSYAAVIGDLYEEGRFENAGKMFDEMVRRGFRPNVAMFERKIEALCREGRVGDGAGVLEFEMKERSCVPSVKAYESVMRGFCEEGKSTRAVEYLKRMEGQVGCVARKESFEIVIGGLLREERFVEAAEVLERMARRNYWAGSQVYGGVIRGLCAAGRRYDAVLWLEEMVSQDKVPEVSVWSSLVSVVCADFDIRDIVLCCHMFVDDST